MNKRKLILAGLVGITFQTFGQVTMVSDIYGGATSSVPDFLFATSDRLYFTADHGTFGVEMWEHTTAGSVVLNYEVNSTGSSSTAGHFVEFNGKIYFQGYESVYGSELYEYDGVNAPIRISDINMGGDNSAPSWLTVFNNKLYFSALGPANDWELYVYDGVNPVSLVMNINTTGNSYPSELTVFNNTLIFRATDGVNGNEVWQYDGINPPSMVMDINAGAGSSNPSFSNYYFCEYNGLLYFAADNGASGAEIWTYDGTSSPAMLMDFIDGSTGFDPRHFYVYQNKLVFSAVDPTLGTELWQYDGINNPSMILDINTNPSLGLHNSFPRHFIEHNGVLYFRATDELHGRELWGWNGVSDPVLIQDINPGTAHSSEDWNLNATKRMVSFNGNLVFAADNGIVGEELFKYEGCLVNADVIQTGLTISANQTGDSYQWIDCATGTAITGETNQTFTPASDGDYKVVITDGLCIDTSDCYAFLGLGIDQNNETSVEIVPNPANDFIYVRTNDAVVNIAIYNLQGALVLSTEEPTIRITSLPSGTYVIQLQTTSGMGYSRFVKE